MEFPLDYVRGCFPALKDSESVYFDNADEPRPLGAVSAFRDSGFDGDPEELLRETRESLAYFLNSNVDWADDEIVIAADVSDLAERLSSVLAGNASSGSRILTTDLEDDESLAPWLEVASNGTSVERWPLKRQTAGLDTDRLDSLVTDETSVVVMSKASRIVGSIVELLPVALGVQSRPASLVVNWSAFLPHGAIDVRFLRSDFVVASTHMFFGADVAFLWGKRERMQQLRDDGSVLFDVGPPSPDALAGFGAALRYIEEIGLITQEMQLQPSEDYGRRRHMRRGMQAIRHYERTLTALMLRRLRDMPGVTVYGISDPDAAAHRMPHVLFRLDGKRPQAVAEALAERGVRVSHGTGGASRMVAALGLPEDEGGVSVSLLHYNESSEIERFADALHEVAAAS